MLKTDTYMRWASTIHNIYTTLTTTTHSPPSRWISVVICIHPLSRQTAPQRKLTPNLRDKVRYVVHYHNLKLYLQLGLVVTRIHWVLMFKQSTWLNTYIDQQHSSAGSSFLKDFFKLMNNIVFGKTHVELIRRCYLTQAGCQTEFL